VGGLHGKGTELTHANAGYKATVGTQPQLGSASFPLIIDSAAGRVEGA
jgi:hypothetical protein